MANWQSQFIEPTEFMQYGTVVAWQPRKGFGFIRPDRGLDVFFHISALGACQAEPRIDIGQPVKYEVDPATVPKRKTMRERLEEAGSKEKTEPQNPRALLVELIDKIPGATLDEKPNETIEVQHHPLARRKKPTWRR